MQDKSDKYDDIQAEVRELESALKPLHVEAARLRARAVTQEAVSEMLGYKRSTIANWEASQGFKDLVAAYVRERSDRVCARLDYARALGVDRLVDKLEADELPPGPLVSWAIHADKIIRVILSQSDAGPNLEALGALLGRKVNAD